MTNVIHQQVQDDNKTVVPTVIFLSLAIFSFSAFSGGAQHCQSEYEQWPVVETTNKAELPAKASDSNAADIFAGTPADLAPYSYGFYSQNYFLESIYARAPAAFSLLS